jgi:hypothetical protein
MFARIAKEIRRMDIDMDWEEMIAQDKKTKDLKIFGKPLEQKEVFEFSRKLAEYIRTEKIKNIVFMDRSARPAYIGARMYLKKRYPEESQPGYFFVNPDGFKTEQSADQADGIDNVWDMLAGNTPRTSEEISQEFQARYGRLLEQKDAPLLLFDTCMHSGDSIRPVLEEFKDNGFSDVRIGLANPPEHDQSGVDVDWSLTRTKTMKECYPYDRDVIVKKGMDSVSTKLNDCKEDRAFSLQIRKEIKKIMENYFELEDRARKKKEAK